MLSTRLYSATGTLRSEDRQLRSVARSRVQSSLAQLQHKYGALASQLAVKVDSAILTDASDIIARVRRNAWLADEFATLDRYTESFPEMKTFVDDKLAHIERRTRLLIVRHLRPTVH